MMNACECALPNSTKSQPNGNDWRNAVVVRQSVVCLVATQIRRLAVRIALWAIKEGAATRYALKCDLKRSTARTNVSRW